jgi:hypothetical protein
MRSPGWPAGSRVRTRARRERPAWDPKQGAQEEAPRRPLPASSEARSGSAGLQDAAESASDRPRLLCGTRPRAGLVARGRAEAQPASEQAVVARLRLVRLWKALPVLRCPRRSAAWRRRSSPRIPRYQCPLRVRERTASLEVDRVHIGSRFVFWGPGPKTAGHRSGRARLCGPKTAGHRSGRARLCGPKTAGHRSGRARLCGPKTGATGALGRDCGPKTGAPEGRAD